MRDTDLVGDTHHGPMTERPPGGHFGDLGARLARLVRTPRSSEGSPEAAAAELQETQEFVPEYVEQTDTEPAAEEWTPRFAMTWRGYHRAAVDDYIRELEDELAAVRTERAPEHAIREEIDRIGHDTAAILRVAQEKADAIASRAHAQADLLVAEAQASAEATTKAAEQRVRALDADTDAVWRDRARLIDDTRKLADGLLAVADDAAERFPPETDQPVEAAGEAPADTAGEARVDRRGESEGSQPPPV